VPAPIVRVALERAKPTGCALGATSRVLVVAGQGGAGQALAARLRARGADVCVLGADEQATGAVEAARAWAGTKGLQGLVWLRSLEVEPSLDEGDEAAADSRMARGVRTLRALARSLYGQFEKPGSFFVTATRMGGTLGYGSRPCAAPGAGAESGLTKAFARERPSALVKVVDFEPDAPADAIAQILCDEIERDPGAVEVGHAGGLRWGVTLLESVAALPQAGSTTKLGPQTVFLVTGAGGAITSAIAADLARASKGVFHLLDLAPAPDASNPDLARVRSDRDGLKRELAERLRAAGSARVTPAMIEKELARIERDAATLDAIRAVEGAGATAVYHPCDVTDSGAVAQVVARVLERHGGIDVVVHAAGLERSRPLDSKDDREFDLVFDVKVKGLANVLRATRGARVDAIVSFSSVAGRFGNAGQTDYSAANDWLCKSTSALARLRPDTRAIAIDWTAWGGIGMATRGSIPEVLRRAGIEMLDPADGVPVLPGVMGIEIFARAALALAPGMRIDSVAGVRFEAPLKCYRDARRTALVTVRLVDGAGGMRAHCELTSLVPTPDSARAPQTKRHFAATLALTRSPSRPPSSPRLETGARLGRVSREDLYRAYFHDASFRVLQGTEVARGGKALVGTLAPGLPALFKTPGARALTAPRLLELCFQTAGVIEIGSTRKLGLPSSIEEVRVHDGADDAAPRFAEVRATREGGALRFDALVRDEAGTVLLEMRGYRTSALPDALPEKVWAPLGAGLDGFEP
jgi:NAD(P)-dependent dehydrogenase (short-subunit alcohol dehydrogenase family)